MIVLDTGTRIIQMVPTDRAKKHMVTEVWDRQTNASIVCMEQARWQNAGNAMIRFVI